MQKDEAWRELDQRLKAMQELLRASGRRYSDLPLALFALEFFRRKLGLQPTLASLSEPNEVLQLARKVEERRFLAERLEYDIELVESQLYGSHWDGEPFAGYLLDDVIQLDEATIAKLLPFVNGAYSERDLQSWLLEQLQSLDFASHHETPHEVADLMLSLPSEKRGMCVFDPACGSGSLLSAAYERFDPAHTAFYGQEEDRYAYSWATVRFALQGAREANVRLASALNSTDTDDGWSQARRRFDVVVTNPPFGEQIQLVDLNWLIPRSSSGLSRSGGKIASELAYILIAHERLKSGGTAAVIIPNGVLFRSGADLKIRTGLVEQGAVDTVIALPARLFAPSTAIETSILILRRPTEAQTDTRTLFIDARALGVRQGHKIVFDEASVVQVVKIFRERLAEPGFSRLVDKAEIETQEFSLVPSKYVEKIVTAGIDDADRRIQIAKLDSRYGELLDEYEVLRKKLWTDGEADT